MPARPTTASAVPSFLQGFRALRHRDYRLFFSGQLISLVGSWMQRLAQSWLVLTLTHSPFALGLVGAIQFLPMLFISPLGGIIADRVPKRTILLGTQAAMMLLAFILAALVWLNLVTYPEILVLAFLLGLANVIDVPTRQAFVVEVVGPDDLMNAIALNSTLFNTARLLGPAIAGLLIAGVGVAMCFFLNGVSFLAVIGGYMMFWAGTTPIGNALVGWAAESTGTFGPFMLGGVASLLAAVAVIPALWQPTPRPQRVTAR
jgi:MFS family permease